MDDLFIHLSGDRLSAEALVGFAKKKLAELPLVRGKNTERKIILPHASIVVSHSAHRKNIYIHVPVSDEKKKEKKFVSEKVGNLLLFWGTPYEVLLTSDATGLFLPNEAVVCSDGSGHVDFVQGSVLVGQYVRCWDPGESITGKQSGATAIIEACYSKEYQYTYTSYSLWSDFVLREGYRRPSPADIFRTVCRDNLNREFRTHTKTLGDPIHGWMTLTAVETQPYASYGIKSNFWFLCAKYNGKQVSFGSKGNYSSGLVMRDTEGDIPILFDLFYSENKEGKEVFHCGECHSEIIIYEFDAMEGLFREKSSNPVVLENNEEALISEYLAGYAEFSYCTVWTQLILHLNGYEMKAYIQTRELSGAVTNKKELKDYDAPEAAPMTLWNHFSDTLFVLYKKKNPEVEPDGPMTDVECLGVEKWVSGYWYTCDYSCAGGYESCNCWVCYDPETFCRPPESFETVEGTLERDAGESSIDWSVRVACCEEHGGNIMTFWTTYHILRYYPAIYIDYGHSYMLTDYKLLPSSRGGSGSEFDGGSQMLGNPTICFSLVDGVRQSDYVPCTEQDNYCTGERKGYFFHNWVFTADSRGYYLDGIATRITCDAAIPEDFELGDSAHACAASPRPYDHNWTLIIKEGTKDTEGKPITPTLFYVDMEQGNKIFISGGGYLPGEGNRAFCQYDGMEFIREVI